MINTGIVQTSNEYDLIRCLGEIDLLKQKVQLGVGLGCGSFNIRDISVTVSQSEIIIQKGSFVGKVENILDSLPDLYAVYWCAYTFDPSKNFSHYAGRKNESEDLR